jgi:hypothetical protein
MADGRVEAPAPSAPQGYLWTQLFRSFQVALDPRKLLVAAVGILIMSLGWYTLSAIFWYEMPHAGMPEYEPNAIKKKLGDKKPDGTNYTDEEYKAEIDKQLKRDQRQWQLLDELAGKPIAPSGKPGEAYEFGRPGGKLRTMPWNEARGPNPYLFASNLVSQPSSTWGGSILSYLSQQIPVLTEPLHKLMIPIVKLIDPNASFQTRVYLLLCLIWSVVVWAFFGGIITRLAAVQFAGKERTTLMEATKFVMSRYVSYVLSPIVPLGIIAVIVLCMFLYGLVALIPYVGDVLMYGLLFPLVIMGGIAMAVILLGLVGYPLMYTTISTEGSDTFDAISRSYNYVFQAPWSFAWYSLVALVYGAAVTFLVILVGCLMMLLGKWGMSSAASAVWSPSKPDYLFVYAPESLGWKELLLSGSDLAVQGVEMKDPTEKTGATDSKNTADRKSWDGGRSFMVYAPANKALNEAYRKDMGPSNKAGAGIVAFWMALVFLMMIGFSYSYFWTASTMIYLLMRKKVDEVELDEVYIEETPPPAPPPVTVVNPPPPPGGASLPVVSPPPPMTVPPPPPTDAPKT